MEQQKAFDEATREAARALIAFRSVYRSCRWWLGEMTWKP
jgi:hypothetical protein